MAASDIAHGHGVAYDHGLSNTAIVAGLAALAAALHVLTPINHDEAVFIEGAGRLLDGSQFGRDVIDMNPPLIWWISAVPVWLARQVGARIEIVATVFMASMAALSLVAVNRLIEADSSVGLPRRALLPIAAILVLFVPGYNFGQREHWAVLLTLPYVVARSQRVDGAMLSTAAGTVIGFAACLGFCIKPHFLLVPISIEIWLLARTRRPSLWICPETIAMAVTGVAYLGLTLDYAPYLERELTNVLLGFWSYNGTMPEVLLGTVTLLAPAAVLALFGYAARRRGEPIPALGQAFAVAGTAYLVAALMQMRPWPYHFLPSVVFFGLAAVVLLITGTPRTGTNTIRLAAFAILIAMGFLPSAAEAVRSFEDGGTTSRIDQLAAVFRANPGPNRTVFGFITSPNDVFPAVIAAGMKWAAPFCCEYLIAAAVRADEAPAADRPAIRAAALDQANTAVSAVLAQEPGVIVMATGDHMLGFNKREFSYLEWLNANTSMASILAHYREINPIGSFRVFVRM